MIPIFENLSDKESDAEVKIVLESDEDEDSHRVLNSGAVQSNSLQPQSLMRQSEGDYLG